MPHDNDTPLLADLPRSVPDSANAFVKHPDQAGSAAAEAAGLLWLADAVPEFVVPVLAVDHHLIATERLSTAHPTPEAARQAGKYLARLHAAGAPAHGAPPAPGGDTYKGQHFIGTQPQDCTPTDRWIDFYWWQRVQPFIDMARSRGTITPRDADYVEGVGRELVSLLRYEPDVARIHGDLWSGNLLFTTRGPVVIDPAAHVGAALTDIAMLSLFGAPYFDELVRGYASVATLDDGWEDLIALHQLHPLAVHVATHGPVYARELVNAARTTERLCL